MLNKALNGWRALIIKLITSFGETYFYNQNGRLIIACQPLTYLERVDKLRAMGFAKDLQTLENALILNARIAINFTVHEFIFP